MRQQTVLNGSFAKKALCALACTFATACDLSLTGDDPLPPLTGLQTGNGSSSGGTEDAGVHVQAPDDSGVVIADAGGGGPVFDGATADAGVVIAPIDAGAPDAGALDAGAADAAPIVNPSHDSGTDASALALPAPIGAWGFDEDVGTTSADLSGNGHPALFVAGAHWGTGKVGGGLALDGTTGYADVGVALIDTTNSFSVAAWVEFERVDAWGAALGQDDALGSLFALKLRGDGTNTFDFDVETSDALNPGFLVAQSTTTAMAGAWVHLAGVYDAGWRGRTRLVLTVYVNGSRAATKSVPQQLLRATGHFVLGRGLYNGAPGSYVDGVVDDVAVYDVALSDAQIGAIYGSVGAGTQ